MNPDVAMMEDDDGQNAPLQGLLSSTLNEKLAALALRSEGVADLAEGLERSGRFLDRCTAEPSDLGATARLLKAKVAQLQELNCQLSRCVMRYSHRLEDAATLATAYLGLDPADRDTAHGPGQDDPVRYP